MNKNYTLENGKFKIRNYEQLPPFSSFLPGIAGIKGIPLWVFYTNRGQGIQSFGIHHKNNAIMEFSPANTAYENASLKGFRTFMKVDGTFYEPFGQRLESVEREMSIEQNLLTIEEKNEGAEIAVKVVYYVLPYENIGALVRDVTIINLGTKEKVIEGFDGMPKIIPFGLENSMYKEMSNLFKSWTEVKNISNNAPFYTQRASSDDSAEVKNVEGGYYYVTIKNGKTVSPVYDPDVVFGYESSLIQPVDFIQNDLENLLKKDQYFVNKVPCGFTPFKETLKGGEELHFTTYVGFSGSVELLNQKVEDFSQLGYGEQKQAEAKKLTGELTADVESHTAKDVFDEYMKQCYLDNFLRGGYPFLFGRGEKKKIVHLYSRKHGDPERDYNFFSTAGEYYSQGNGNFRDVCQNRRNDVLFNPEIEDFNVYMFFSLVQMDGYNPLEIRPSTFRILPKNMREAEALMAFHVRDEEGILKKLIRSRFTPGQVAQAIAVNGLDVKGQEDRLIEDLLELSVQEIEAGFGEGYWSDHWGYLMDLIDSYLAIYPEKQEELLFENAKYRIYDSVGVVRPRKETYVLGQNGPRQYGSICHDKQKASQEGFQESGTNWLKTADGKVVETTLLGKMLLLAVNKFALLDSYGMGIEMEGGKPGWNDAMNGLPGLFGSGMAETLELKRLVHYLQSALADLKKERTFFLPEELVSFAWGLYSELNAGHKDFAYWDKTASLKESYRESIKYHTSGKEAILSVVELTDILDAFAKKLEKAVAKALEVGDGVMPTYFTYEAVTYEKVLDEAGQDVITPYGLPSVKVLEFKQQVLPKFLEGPAKYLSSAKQADEGLSQMCQKIKESGLYDNKLKMYKTCEPLEQISMENGRIRAFTPGWLERESVFLHMEYKYFLGMLSAGLYHEFWEALKDALIPFQKPEVYGRSILENSSFLASCVNPDPNVHGRGFVARLSGSTVEMLSMWIQMFWGKKGFFMENGYLSMTLNPILPDWMFNCDDIASFTLLKHTKIVYHNLLRKNTYGSKAVKVVRMEVQSGSVKHLIEGDTLSGELAEAVRNGKVEQIDAFLL